MRTMAFRAAILIGALIGVGAANAMTVTSPDIKPGGKIADEQVFNGWDCTGQNVSPALSWSGAPKDTKSFAVSMYRSRRADRQRLLALVGRQYSRRP